MKIQKIVSFSAALLCMAFIFYASSKPSDKSDEMSKGFLASLIKIATPDFDSLSAERQAEILENGNFYIRKAAHFSVYLVLGVSVSCFVSTYNRKRLQAAGISLGICAAYAVTDEIHQLFVPGRSGELRDVCIDSLGALIGIGIVLLILAVKRIKFQKQSLG